LQLQHAARREGATAVIEIHHLRAEVQMTAHVEHAARVGQHLVECQAQFIQVEAGCVTQGVKKAGVHPAILTRYAHW
jgi:hypothetical protein